MNKHWDALEKLDGGEPPPLAPTVRETSADELAEAVEHLRERLDTCKRGFGDVPQSLTDHAVEIVLGELERLREQYETLQSEDHELHGAYLQLRARDEAAKAVVQEWAQYRARGWTYLTNALDALARTYEAGGTGR